MQSTFMFHDLWTRLAGHCSLQGSRQRATVEPLDFHLAVTIAVIFTVAIHPAPAAAATLEVGPGKAFATIEDAHARAVEGDMILVHPRENGQPYERVAVFVKQPRLTFRAARAGGRPRVRISGRGFDYSGIGSTPRAVFQFNPGADGCVLEGFELFGAHNESHNGAGVRIAGANHVVVRDCAIHDNDMGIMSNGDGTTATGVDQRIERCEIHHNGDTADPGQNHNLYLGGTSVTLSACDVHHSLTGHNVKSRAHHTRVEYSFIHDSANREFDLVDAADTARPGSDAVLLGNIIVKDPESKGNRTVIHFGQDGGKPHDGTLHLAFNTVVTPFVGPIVELSAPAAKVRMVGNLVSDGGLMAVRDRPTRWCLGCAAGRWPRLWPASTTGSAAASRSWKVGAWTSGPTALSAWRTSLPTPPAETSGSSPGLSGGRPRRCHPASWSSRPCPAVRCRKWTLR